MNASSESDPDPDFESVLRQRSLRLAIPDPAWREQILGSALGEPTFCPRRTRRPFWKTRWLPASLAACWVIIPLLNWSAGRETRRFSQYANAEAVPMFMGGWDRTPLLAVAPSP